MYRTTIKAAVVIVAACALMMSGLVVLAQAADVTLAWDHNDPLPWENTENTQQGGYRIYHRIENESYDYSQWAWTGQENTATLTGLAEDTTHYFVVRAWADQQESADSEEVAFVASQYRPLPNVVNVRIETISIPVQP